MRLRLLEMCVVAAMLLVATSATAGGINLAWSNCFGEGTGKNNRSFACDTNEGTNLLVVSFVLDHDLVQVAGNELVLDLFSPPPSLPDWWAFKDLDTCRQRSLRFNATANASDVVCVDWAAGQSAGGIGRYSYELGHFIDSSLLAQHRRLVLALAVPLARVADLLADTEYFSCNIVIDNLKTVGTGSCAGCTEPICVVLNSIKVTTPVGVNDVYLVHASTPGSNIVTWQGIGPDCLAVPVKNATWGQVKALYR